MYQQHLDNQQQFICPICGSSQHPLLPVGSEFPILSKLQIIGAGNRLQRCHGCKSSDRDRLVYLYLKDYECLFNEKASELSILHVAPEECIANILTDKYFINYVAIDSFEHGYLYPSYVKNMNLLNLQFPNESFEYVICNHVLQDIKDDIAAINEIFRVLKHGGKAILQVPISYMINEILEYNKELSLEKCQELYGQRFHKRVYNKTSYVDRLKSVGFKVNVINLSNDYTQNSLNHLEEVFLAIKE